MLRNYRLIWDLLNARERRQFVLIVILTVFMGMFEVLGVASILPFLSLLGNPEMIETNRIIALFARTIGQDDPFRVTVGFGMAVLVLLLLGMVVRAAGTYAQTRFSLMRGYTIAARQLRLYLHQPYVWFLSQNTAEFGQSLLSEVDLVVRQSILPAVLMISNGTITLLIVALLFIVAPGVALGASALLISVYLLVYTLLRGQLDRVGAQRIKSNRDRFQIVQEIGGGIKEIKVMGQESVSLTRFRGPSRDMAQAQSLANIIGKLPRYALEGVIYGGFIVMVLIMLGLRGRELGDLVPLFGLLGMASMKLFPALQQIYNQLAMIRFSAPALQRLHDSASELKVNPLPVDETPLRLKETLELRNLKFSYPGAERPTLDGLSAIVPARSTLGIVGGTGAGKTTVVDLILGLLVPDGGEIVIDGTVLTPDRLRGWQGSLGYVPQSIFLMDDSVTANIAYGVPEAEIDMAAVERAAKTANLHDFIVNELPEGYSTHVGERGVRLSGGQRQRIGIARALYRDPDVLVLDEATSALDNLTERAVMEAVHNLGGEKTVIMIAHRLSTVQTCDKILMLERGQVVAEGRYDELLRSHEEFRRMAVV